MKTHRTFLLAFYFCAFAFTTYASVPKEFFGGNSSTPSSSSSASSADKNNLADPQTSKESDDKDKNRPSPTEPQKEDSVKNLVSEDTRDKISKAEELDKKLLEKLKKAIDDNIQNRTSSRAGPDGGNLACEWMARKVEEQFLRDVANEYGQDVADALKTKASNGVTESYNLHSKNENWVEVPFSEAPEGARVYGFRSGGAHGHSMYKWGDGTASNSSGAAQFQYNYRTPSSLRGFSQLRAMVPIYPRTLL